VAARSARERAREEYPKLAARYARHQALAEAALVERERRKQGPPTGKGPRRQRRPVRPKGVHISRVVRQLTLRTVNDRLQDVKRPPRQFLTCHF